MGHRARRPLTWSSSLRVNGVQTTAAPPGPALCSQAPFPLTRLSIHQEMSQWIHVLEVFPDLYAPEDPTESPCFHCKFHTLFTIIYSPSSEKLHTATFSVCLRDSLSSKSKQRCRFLRGENFPVSQSTSVSTLPLGHSPRRPAGQEEPAGCSNKHQGGHQGGGHTGPWRQGRLAVKEHQRGGGSTGPHGAALGPPRPWDAK